MTKGEKIKYLRESIGMTQSELAKRINSTKQNIYKYECGIVTNIPSDKIEEIATILGTTPQYLMGWAEKYDTSNQSIVLSDEENRLLDSFRKLNHEGQEKLLDYGNDLIETGKYKKSDKNELDA